MLRPCTVAPARAAHPPPPAPPHPPPSRPAGRSPCALPRPDRAARCRCKPSRCLRVVSWRPTIARSHARSRYGPRAIRPDCAGPPAHTVRGDGRTGAWCAPRAGRAGHTARATRRPFPATGARSLRTRRMRPPARVNRSPTFDPPRRRPPFGRAGGARTRGLRHCVSCRLLPAINRAHREKKVPFAGHSMPRRHRAPGMPGRLAPPGPATRSRHAFARCARHTCLDAGKTVLAIGSCCARVRSRAPSGAPSRRPDATHRRCRACIGARPDRAVNCMNRPGPRYPLGERRRR